MASSVVYIDESGNEGDVAGHAAPFTSQSTFVLAGVLEDDGSEAAESLVSELRSQHKMQANELKWKSFAKKPAAFSHLIRDLRRLRLVPFVEVMNKRHYVASNIVTYVLGRRQIDFADSGQIATANACADLLASEIGDRVLLAYASFSKDPSAPKFEEFLLLFREGLDEATAAHSESPRLLALLFFIGEVLDTVVHEWQAATPLGDVHRFVQEPDQSIGGHRLGLLPQVQAFCNLCGRLNAYVGHEDRVRLVHDEQSEFRALIEHYFSLLASNEHLSNLAIHTAHAQARVSWDFPINKFRLSFDDSKRSAGVQIADVLAGFCRSRLDAVTSGRPTDRLFDAAACDLADFSPPAGLLLVATDAQVRAFFNGASDD